MSRMWTALAVPSATLPSGCGRRGLLLGTQLLLPCDDDESLPVLAEFAAVPLGR